MSHLTSPPPEWLTAGFMEQHLKKAFQDSELTIKEIKVESGSSAGEGYLCQILRVIVEISKSSKGNYTLPLIAKLEPSSNISKELEELDAYTAEAMFFSTILPKFEKYIQASSTNRQTYLPKFYFLDPEKRIIFMEDLRAAGFGMQPRTKFLTLEQTVLGVEAIATFHGASMLLLKDEPEIKLKYTFNPWAGELPNVFVLINTNGIRSLEKHVKSYGLPEKYSKRILEMQQDIDAGKLKICASKEGEINVLNHGDLNKNNLMHHFNNGVADDIRIIDFQSMSYNCFANDLQYFLFLNASSETLVTKLDFLLEKYYKKLREVAPSIENITLERIKTEFAMRYFFGYLLAVLFRPFLLAEVPFDMDKILKKDGIQDNGFGDAIYIDDLKRFLPFFEKAGIV